MSNRYNIRMASTDPWRYTHHLPSDPSFQQPNVRVTSLYVGSEQQTLSSRVQKLDFGEVALLITTAGLAFLILIPKVNAYCYTAQELDLLVSAFH